MLWAIEVMGYKDDNQLPLKADNAGEPFATIQAMSSSNNCQGATRGIMDNVNTPLITNIAYSCGGCSACAFNTSTYTDPTFRATPFTMTGWNKPYDIASPHPEQYNLGGMYARNGGGSTANRFYHYFPASKDGDYVMLKYAEVLVYTQVEVFIHFVNCNLASTTSTNLGGTPPWTVYGHLPRNVGSAADDLWGNTFTDTSEWTLLGNINMYTHASVCNSVLGVALQKTVSVTVSAPTPFDGVAIVRTSNAGHLDYVEFSAVRVTGQGFTPLELYFYENTNSGAVTNPSVNVTLIDSGASTSVVTFTTAGGQLNLTAVTSNVATVSANRDTPPDTVRDPVANVTVVVRSDVRFPSSDISLNHLYFPGRAAAVKATVTRAPTMGNVTSLGFRYPTIATAWAYDVCAGISIPANEICPWAPNLPPTWISVNQRSHKIPGMLFNHKAYFPHMALGPPDVVGEAIMYDHHALFELRYPVTDAYAYFVLEAEVMPVRVVVHHNSPTFCLFEAVQLHKASCGGGVASWLPSNTSCWIDVPGVSTDSYTGQRKIRPNTVRRYPVPEVSREAVDGIYVWSTACSITMAQGTFQLPVYLDAIGVEYERYPPLVTYTPNPAFAGSAFTDSFDVTVTRMGFPTGVTQTVQIKVLPPTPLGSQPAPPAVAVATTGGTSTNIDPVDLEVPLPSNTSLGGRGFYPVIITPPSYGSIELLYSPLEPATASAPPGADMTVLNETNTSLPIQWASTVISDSRAKTWFPLRVTGHELRTQYPAQGALGRPMRRSFGFHASSWVPVDATEEDTAFSTNDFYRYASNPVPEQKLCVGFSTPVYPSGLNIVFSYGAHAIKSVRMHRYQPSDSPYMYGPADAADATWVQFDFTPVDFDQEVKGRRQLEILFPSFPGATPDTLYDAACITVNTTKEAVNLVVPNAVTNPVLDEVAFYRGEASSICFNCALDTNVSCTSVIGPPLASIPSNNTLLFLEGREVPSNSTSSSANLGYMYYFPNGTRTFLLREQFYKPMGSIKDTSQAVILTPATRRIAGQFISIDAIGLLGYSFPRVVARYRALATTTARNVTFQIALTDGVTTTQPRTFHVSTLATQTRSLPFVVALQVTAATETTATVSFTAPADLPSPSGVTGFEFYYTTEAAVTSTTVWLSGGTKLSTSCFAVSCSYQITGLTPGQAYIFAMVSRNPYGDSLKGGTDSVTLPNLSLGTMYLNSTATNFTQVTAELIATPFAQNMVLPRSSYCGWDLTAVALDPRAVMQVSFDDWATSTTLASSVAFPSPKLNSPQGVRYFNVSVKVTVTVASTLNAKFYNFSLESTVPASMQVQAAPLSLTSANISLPSAGSSTPQSYTLRNAATGALLSAGLTLPSLPGTLSELQSGASYTLEMRYNDTALCPTYVNFTLPINTKPSFLPNPALVGYVFRPADVLALIDVFSAAAGVSMGTGATENGTQSQLNWTVVGLDPAYVTSSSVNTAGKLTLTANPPASFPAGETVLFANFTVLDNGGTVAGGVDTSDVVSIGFVFRRGAVSAVAFNTSGTEASTLAFNLSLNFVPTSSVSVYFTPSCFPLSPDPGAGVATPLILNTGQAWRVVPMRIVDDLVQSANPTVCTITFTTLSSTSDPLFASYPNADGPPAALTFTFAEDDQPAATLGGPMTFALGGSAVSLNGYLIFNLSIGTTVSSVTVTVSNAAMFSVAPTVSISGANGTLAFTPAPISVAPGTSNLQFTLTYANGLTSPPLGPVMFTFTSTLATVSSVAPTSGPLAGGNVVTLTGAGFGGAAANLTSVNVTDGNVTLKCTAMAWLSPTSVTCTVPAHLATSAVMTLAFAVGVAGMPPGLASGQIYTYNPVAAVGAAFPPSMLALNRNVTTVVITASPPSATLALSGADIVSVTLAGVPCAVPVWINASALSCTPGLNPSGATSGPVVVTTLSAGTSSGGAGATFAYRSASISAVSPAGCALAGGCLITLVGAGFASGVAGDAVTSVLLAGRNCTSPSAVSDTTLVCTVDGSPAAVGPGPAALTTALGGPASLAAAFTFFVAPEVLSVSPPTGAMAGGYTVLVTGNLFGNSSADLVSVWLGVTKCSAAAWISPTLVNCTAGPAPAAGPVVVSVSLTGPVFGVSATPIFTYAAPAANTTANTTPTASVAPSAAPSAAPSVAPSSSPDPMVVAVVPALGYTPGGDPVTMVGRNFGVDRFALLSARLGTLACKAFAWVSASAVTCTTPAGAVGFVTAFVETRAYPTGSTSKTGAVFEYARPNPALLGAFPRDLHPPGGDVVTVVGKYFGASAAEAAPISILFQGVAPCASPKWLTDSTISCVTPPAASLGGGVTTPSVEVRVGASPMVGSTMPASVARLQYKDPPFIFCVPSCGFHGNCVSTQTDAHCVCDKGYKPPPTCDSPTIVIDTVSYQSSEDDGRTAEVRVSLGLAPGGPVTVAVTARFVESTTGARPGLAVLESTAPAVLTASNFDTPLVFKLGAPLDDVRSGKTSYEAVVTTSSPQDPQFDAVPLSPVALQHSDVRPSVTSVRPTVLPLAGGVLTIKGDHFDSAVRVSIQGVPANVTAVVTRSGKRIVIDPAVSTILKTRWGALQRVVAPDELETVTQIEFASPPIYTAAGGQYAKMEVLNMFEGSLVQTSSDVYYTEDCPSEGQYGRGAKCARCPEGAYCPGGWRMRATPGFWNPGEDFPWVVQCDPPDACLGWIEKAKINKCAVGYTGYACSECVPGYFKLNGLCQVCPQPGPLVVFLTTDILVWVLYALAGAFLENREHFSLVIGLMMSVQQAGSVGSQVASELPRWVLKIYEVGMLGFFVVFFFFFQSTFLTIFSSLILAHLFAGDISFIKPDCLGRTPFEASWIIKLVYTILTGLPIILFTVLGRFFSVRYHRSRNSGEEVVQGRYAHYSSRLRRVCLVHLMVTFLTLANIAFKAIACERAPNGTIVSIGEPEHKCFTASHLPVFIVGVLMLIALLGFPVALLFFYRVNSALLYSDHTFQMRWDSPYVQFHFKWRLTWLFDMLVGISISLTSVFFQIWPKTQLAILISVFSLYALFLIIFRPYRNMWENVAAISLQCCNSLITVIIYLQKSTAGGMSKATRLGLVSTSCALFAITIGYQVTAVIYQVFVKWLPAEEKLKESMSFAQNENHVAKNGVVGEFFTMDRDPAPAAATGSLGLGKGVSARSAEEVILEGSDARDAIALATPGGQPGAVPQKVDGQEEEGVVAVISKSFGQASNWLASFFASDSDAAAQPPAAAPIGGFFTPEGAAPANPQPGGPPPPLTPKDLQSQSDLSQAGSEANLLKKNA
jgi:hypothetical protein